jgi:hypothetical protein
MKNKGLARRIITFNASPFFEESYSHIPDITPTHFHILKKLLFDEKIFYKENEGNSYVKGLKKDEEDT